MKSAGPLIALFLLTGCGQSSPVAGNAAAPPDNAVGDASAGGLAAPANASAAERSRDVAAPAPTDGMSWSWNERAHEARFGPAAGPPTFSIACDMATHRMVIDRFDPASANATATLSFTGSGRVASLPAMAVGRSTGISVGHWQASGVASDLIRAVGRVFDGSAAVQIVLGGAPRLVAPASPLPRRAFDACQA